MSRTSTRLGRLLAVAVLGTLLFVPFRTGQAQFRASASIRDGSLGQVPADVAFYGATLRTGETFERFTSSKAFERLRNMESVQTLTEEFLKQWNDPTSDFAQAREVFERESTQKTLAFLGDMFSHETWSMGDMKHGDLVELGAVLGIEMRKAQNEMQLKQAQGEEVNPMDIANGFIRALDQNRHLIVIPNSITGFRVENTDRAAEQLAALDDVITQAVAGNPVLKKAYSKQVIADVEYLVLDLKGNMVPWQLAGFFLQGIDFQAFNRVVGQLNGLELTLAIGLKDDNVLFLMGESNAYLQTLGQGDLLIDRDEFAPIRANENAPFTSVQYVSDAYVQRVGQANDPVAALQQVHDMMQPLFQQINLNEELRAMIAKDLADAGEFLKEKAPKPGATLTYEYSTERGYEGYSYNWGENAMLDGTKPLPLAKHVGGNPVGFYVARAKYNPEDYDNMVVVLTKLYGYAETYLKKELNDEERAEYEKIMGIVGPHLKRLDDTTRTKLVPALKDGQGAIVLDMKATSRQWFTEMPVAKEPVAMPAIAFVYGVDDADLLSAAMGDYHDIFQGLLDDLHEYSPDEIPAIKLPAAKKEMVDAGTLFEYDVPRDNGLDEQIAPSAGLSDSVAVWGYVPAQTRGILAETPVDADGGPLADLDRNLAGAGRFNFAAFIEGIEPWVEYGVSQYYASQAVGIDGDEVVFQDPPMEKVLAEVRTVAEVLKCFRGYSSVTTIEDGATVTHFDFHFEDLE